MQRIAGLTDQLYCFSRLTSGLTRSDDGAPGLVHARNFERVAPAWSQKPALAAGNLRVFRGFPAVVPGRSAYLCSNMVSGRAFLLVAEHLPHSSVTGAAGFCP